EDVRQAGRARQRAAHAHGLERLLVELEAREAHHRPGILHALHPGLLAARHVEVEPPHDHLVFGSEVDLAAAPRGQARRRVAVEAGMSRNHADGSFSTKRTVWRSRTSMWSTDSRNCRLGLPATVTKRS